MVLMSKHSQVPRTWSLCETSKLVVLSTLIFVSWAASTFFGRKSSEMLVQADQPWSSRHVGSWRAGYPSMLRSELAQWKKSKGHRVSILYTQYIHKSSL